MHLPSFSKGLHHEKDLFSLATLIALPSVAMKHHLIEQEVVVQESIQDKELFIKTAQDFFEQGVSLNNNNSIFQYRRQSDAIQEAGTFDEQDNGNSTLKLTIKPADESLPSFQVITPELAYIRSISFSENGSVAICWDQVGFERKETSQNFISLFSFDEINKQKKFYAQSYNLKEQKKEKIYTFTSTKEDFKCHDGVVLDSFGRIAWIDRERLASQDIEFTLYFLAPDEVSAEKKSSTDLLVQKIESNNNNRIRIIQ